MNQNLIVDGMNIAFRCHHVYDVQQGLTTTQGLPSGMLYGFMRSFLKWKQDYPKHRVVVAWDTPTGSQPRKNICASYKANRDRNHEPLSPEVLSQVTQEDVEMVDAFGLQVTFIKSMLSKMGIEQYEAPYFEADDVIHTLVRETFDGDVNVVYTSDRDMLQLVDSKTVVMTPSGKAYDSEKVMEEYGVPPRLLHSFRTLDGDKSDGLAGLPRFRKKVIASLVNKHDGDLEAIFTQEHPDLSKKEREKLKAFEEAAKVNYEVMRLRNVPDLASLPTQEDEEGIEEICNLFELSSLAYELKQVRNPSEGFTKFMNQIS